MLEGSRQSLCSADGSCAPASLKPASREDENRSWTQGEARQEKRTDSGRDTHRKTVVEGQGFLTPCVTHILHFGCYNFLPFLLPTYKIVTSVPPLIALKIPGRGRHRFFCLFFWCQMRAIWLAQRNRPSGEDSKASVI